MEVIEKPDIVLVCKGNAVDALDLRPEHGEPEYMEAIGLDKISKMPPAWDVPRQGPIGTTNQMKRELATAKIFLDEQRMIGNYCKNKKRKEWVALREEQIELRNNFRRYNTMLKENKEKITRAVVKEALELEKHVEIRAEIALLKNVKNYYQDVELQMKHHINTYKLYENFMNEIVAHTTKFDQVDDVFNSYKSLASARELISLNHYNLYHDLQYAMFEIENMSIIKNNALIEMTSELSDLDFRHDKAQRISSYWEAMIPKIKEVVATKEGENYMVQQMTWELYNFCCERKHVEPEVKKMDMEGQYEFIKTAFREQQMIAQRARILKAEYVHELAKAQEVEKHGKTKHHGPIKTS